MRPLSQVAVISTHSLLFLAPAVTGLTISGALTLTRFSRASFFFISALVLTLTYDEYFDRRLFWRHRLRRIVVPYLAWTLIYYVFISARSVSYFPYYLVSWRDDLSVTGLHHLVTLVVTGYYQLYFLVVLMQFYVIFPAVLRFLEGSRRRHLPTLIVALAWQVLFDQVVRHHLWHLSLGGKLETRLVLSYPIYLLGGMVAALNYREFHSWVTRHAAEVLVATGAAFALVLTLDAYAGTELVAAYLTPGSDVYALAAVLFDVGAILSLYLGCAALTSPRRSWRLRRALASGADASYGVYLSQMLWLPVVVRLLATAHLEESHSWPLLVPMAVTVTCVTGYCATKLWHRAPLVHWNVRRVGERRRRDVARSLKT